VARFREATMEDLREVTRMTTRFFESTDYSKLMGIQSDPQSVVNSARTFITSPECFVGITDGGMICGKLGTWPINLNQTVAQEIAWWVDPDKRGGRTAIELFKGFKAWAIRVGAAGITMSCLDCLNGEKISKFYERLGFRQSEKSFVMRLEN